MKLIDEKGKIFGKISFIDLFAIIVVIIIGLLFLQKSFLNSQLRENIGEEKTVQVTVFLQELTENQINVLQEGSAKLQKTGRNADVNIVGIDVEQGKELVETKDGEIVIATNPLLFDAKVFVEGIGEITSERIVIDNLEVRIGTELRLMTKQFEGLGIVYNIKYQ